MALRKMFCLLLAVLLALPGLTTAVDETLSLQIIYRQDDGMGGYTENMAVPNVDYTYGYTADADSVLWIQLLNAALPMDNVSVTLWDAMGNQVYVLADALTGSQELNLSAGLGSYAVLDMQGVQVESVLLNATTEPMPVPEATPETPPVVNETLPGYESAYGYPAAGASVYDANGNAVDSFVGSAMQFTGNSYNGADGTLYLEVQSEDGWGYVRLADWTFMTKAEEEAYLTPPVVNETLPGYESAYGYPAAGAQLYDQAGNLAGAFVGDAMQFTGNSYNGADGTLYLEVQSEDGSWGYVRLADWTFMTKAEEEAHLATPVPDPTQQVTEPPIVPVTPTPTPTPTPTQEPTQEITPAPTATATQIITQAPTQTATAVPTVPPTVAPTVEAQVVGYAYVTKNQVNVRRSPSTGSTAMTQVNATDVVKVDGNERDAEGTLWYYVTLESGTSGWIRNDLIRMMTADEQQAYLATLVTPVPTATQYITPIPMPTATVAPAQQVGYMYVIYANVPFYNWPNSNAMVQSLLPMAEVVYVSGQEYGNDGTSFSRALYQGQWGYIPTGYVRMMTDAELAAYFATAAPTPTAAPTYSLSSYSGYAMLIRDNVNFRKTASSSGTVLMRLSQGTLVKVNTYTSADGYEWYQCVSGNTTGYLRGDMISLLNVGEYQTLLASSNTNSSGNTVTYATPRATSITVNSWATANPGSTITFITIPPLATTTPSPLPTATIVPATFQPVTEPAATPTAESTAQGMGGTGFATIPPTASYDPQATLAPVTDREFETEEEGGLNVGALVIALVVLLLLCAAGLYGYSVYNKARRKQAEERARKMAATAHQRARQDGARPAVRRTDAPPAASRPASQQNPYARPQSGAQGGQTRPAQTQQRPLSTPQETRPQTPTRTVQSSVPRASVDGHYVGENNQAKDPNQMYSRPASEDSAIKKPQTTQAGQPYAQSFQRQRMPIAPEPVKMEDVQTNTAQPQAGQAEEAPTYRRRRRQSESEAANKDQE